MPGLERAYEVFTCLLTTIYAGRILMFSCCLLPVHAVMSEIKQTKRGMLLNDHVSLELEV